jgi:hypothetical protein
VLLVAVLHFLSDKDSPSSIVATIRDAGSRSWAGPGAALAARRARATRRRQGLGTGWRWPKASPAANRANVTLAVGGAMSAEYCSSRNQISRARFSPTTRARSDRSRRSRRAA